MNLPFGMRRAAAMTLAGAAALAGAALAVPAPDPGPRAPAAGRVFETPSPSQSPSKAADAPRRVVSLNLCTDQLAMLLAAPGQLLSVSSMASDPHVSAMRDRAGAFAVNHGRAEEIFLMRPDLVLAGTYTARETVSMLRRLGFRVETFAPEADFDVIRANIRRMGALLGREAQAEAMTAEMDARLEAARPAPDAPRPLAALLEAASWSSGAGTLAHEIVTAAGLRNLGAELGITGMARLPLERLVMGAPELLIAARPYTPPSLSEQGMRHPALDPLQARAGRVALADARWVCGAPFTAEAVADLSAARRALTGEGRSAALVPAASAAPAANTVAR